MSLACWEERESVFTAPNTPFLWVVKNTVCLLKALDTLKNSSICHVHISPAGTTLSINSLFKCLLKLNFK